MAHRTHAKTELELDVLLVGPSRDDLHIRDWARMQLEGSLEDKLWWLGMLVERGYSTRAPRTTHLSLRSAELPTIATLGPHVFRPYVERSPRMRHDPQVSCRGRL